MTSQLMRDLRGLIEAALSKEADAFKAMGVDIKIGAGRYSPQNGTFKIEIADVVGGKIKSKEANLLEMCAKSQGLPDDILGKIINFGADVFTVEGMNRGGKLIIRKQSDGKSYKTTVPMVKLALGIKPSISAI